MSSQQPIIRLCQIFRGALLHNNPILMEKACDNDGDDDVLNVYAHIFA